MVNPFHKLATGKTPGLQLIDSGDTAQRISTTTTSTFADHFSGAPALDWIEVHLTQQHIDEGRLTHIEGVFLDPSGNPVALALAESLGQQAGTIEAYAEYWKRVDSKTVFMLNDDLWHWLGHWCNHDYRFCTPLDTVQRLELESA